MPASPKARSAGVVLPLFSIRTRRDWGIGQITDLPAAAAFVRRAGHSLLQILPPHELSAGETSPYGALTAFGLDPIYAGIEAIVDLDAEAIDALLGEDGKRELAAARAARHVDYAVVRKWKTRALHAAFERFRDREWSRSTPRAKELAAFIAAERAWIDDLALYTVLRESRELHGWSTWPEPERDRSVTALEKARADHAWRMLEVAYVQWVLLAQWDAARAAMRAAGVELMGDLPFVVCPESADVWARASQFQQHMSLGAPPDGFAPDGQDWGLPPYNWLSMEADDFAWVRARTRHAARLYDRFRLDHVVGYFRQWVKPRSGDGHGNADAHPRGHFDPPDGDSQSARGRRVLGVMQHECDGSQIIAEDLGVIPPFVRHTLGEMQIPGYKVIPWEKDEHHRFRDASQFPAISVATYSTHDTPPITAWWDDLSGDERAELARRAGITADTTPDERSLALLGALYRSSSSLTLVLAQEVLGERERINTPGTVGDENWVYRLPAPIEDLEHDPRVVARMAAVRRMTEESGR